MESISVLHVAVSCKAKNVDRRERRAHQREQEAVEVVQGGGEHRHQCVPSAAAARPARIRLAADKEATTHLAHD